MNRELLKKTLNANLDSLTARSRTLGGYLSQLSAEDYWDRLIPAKETGYTLRIEWGSSVKSVNSGYDPFKEAQKHLDENLKARVSNDLSTIHYFGAGLGYHLKLMAEYYLTHEAERLDIAERGKAAVKGKHTVTNRVKFMLSKVEGLRKAHAPA